MSSCPSPRCPRLRLGQPARLFTDAGGAPIDGTVSYISPKAEFTPRNVQTAEERSKLVYRIRIAVDNTGGRAQAGHAGRSRARPPASGADRMAALDSRSRHRLRKRYGAVDALKGISFQIDRGEMFGLIGPDGAGKTTTIRLLCGLLHPDEGEVRILGHDPVTSHRAITASVGYLSQRFSLYGDLSIDENIAFFAEIHGVRRLSRSPQSPAGHDPADAVPAPPRRSALRRHEAEAGARLHPRPRARDHHPRRADDRCRPGVAPRVLEAALAVPRTGHHHPHVHALPRRSRALPPDCAAARGRGAGARRARPAARARCPGSGSRWSSTHPREAAARLRAAGRRARAPTCLATGCTSGWTARRATTRAGSWTGRCPRPR